MTLTAAQRAALDPQSSIWLEASAGSGKTRVLTDRLLVLMLEGALPDRLLCLTFTKAAAAEMDQRLKARLDAFSMMDEEARREAILALGLRPTSQRVQRAASLFHQVLALPRGLRIQTLHSFCERLMRAFPIEAGLFPYFRVMDEYQALRLWKQAVDQTLRRAKNSACPLKEVVPFLARRFSYEALSEIMNEMMGRRSFDQEICTEPVALRQALGVHAACKEDLWKDQLSKVPWALYHQLIAGFNKAALEDHSCLERLEQLEVFVANPSEANLKGMRTFFLTQAGVPRKTVLAKKLRRFVALPDGTLVTQLQEEAERLAGYTQACAALALCEVTQMLGQFYHAAHDAYKALKRHEGVLDYDDLIQKTAHLLDKEDAWIAYKLDSGIDHILVDEAQDTSRLQWRVIEGLMRVFFDESDAHKTVFVVGDPKQSIYSFQGADPAIFRRMGQVLEQRLRLTGRAFKRLALKTSFRSVPSVLACVDAVFAQPEAAQGVGEGIRHDAAVAYKDKTGTLTLWPLLEDVEEKGDQGLAAAVAAHMKGPVRLAWHIAHEIHTLLEQGAWVETENRPLVPSDIMVLVRKRGPLVMALQRFLKERGVLVMGQDRLMLTESLAVQDLLALATFCTTPFDDLTLSSVLKSPFVGCSEEALFSVTHGRAGAVWNALQDRQEPWARQAVHFLSQIKKESETYTPAAFFERVLWLHKGAYSLEARLGRGVPEILDAFLTLVRAEECHAGYDLGQLVEHLKAHPVAVKQQDEQARGVRIMTVHGAKGLEAPLVFLADAGSVRSAVHRLLWMPKSGKEHQAIPLLSSGATSLKALEGFMQTERKRQEEEYNRLLYVGLTRASNHVHVSGWCGRLSDSQSWHKKVKAGLTSMHAEHLEKKALSEQHGMQWGTQNFHSQKKEHPQSDQKQAGRMVAHPVWLKKPFEEATTVSVVTPSTVLMPVQKETSTDAKGMGPVYGQLVHDLLSKLPLRAQTEWEHVAKIAAAWLDAPPDYALKAFKEVRGVLAHPDLSFLMNPGALREVSLESVIVSSHALGTQLLVGRLDFLLECPDAVWVVDFKTGRAPAQEEPTPPHYAQQMALYKDALSPLYTKPIKTFLLWTGCGLLQEA